jgi:hypothetical protein
MADNCGGETIVTTVEQLETQLRATGKFWRYATRTDGSSSDQSKIEVAQAVLNSGKSWAERLAAEFSSRRYPPGYDEGDDQ